MKTSSFYISGKNTRQRDTPLEAKPSCVHDITWQFSNGMHLFRQFERETLRVLSARQIRKRGYVPPDLVQVVQSESLRRVLKELPLSMPARRSKARRVATRFLKSAQREPVRVVKTLNPVKVEHPKKGLSYKQWSHSLFFWICAKVKRTGPAQVPLSKWVSAKVSRFGKQTGGKFIFDKRTMIDTYDAIYSPPLTKRKVATEIGLHILSEASKPRSFVRKGSNRKEKRRSWVTERVLKKIPERTKRMVTPREFRVVMSEARGCKGVLHSRWISKRIESIVENRKNLKILSAVRKDLEKRALMPRKVIRLLRYANWPLRSGGFCSNRAYALPQTANRRQAFL